MYFRDAGPTEVGGFGISAPHDLLSVQDVQLVTQICTAHSVLFDDTAVADFFDVQLDLGREPEQCGRIWIHTHPGLSATPSATDRQTFQRVFGRCDWAVMLILARSGRAEAKLFRRATSGSCPLPIEIDDSQSVTGTALRDWGEEYHRCMRVAEPRRSCDPTHE